MSDTPRTDAECGWYDPNGVRYQDPTGDHVDPDFTRQLERELNAAKARIARLEEALNTCDDNFSRFAPQEGSRYGDSWQAAREALGRHNPWEHWTP